MESVKKFERENRYIVIKRSDLKKVPVTYRSTMITPMFNLLPHLPRRECVVVESDWPEYEIVWAMIEHRMGGKPVPDFDRVSAENLALQQRLTVQDQREDDLKGLLRQAKLAVDDVADNCEDQADWATASSMHALSKRIDAVLKPTAEAEPQCLLCLDKKTVLGNIPGGFVKDCPDCCGEEG
jgi:hypothetical protein